MKTLQMAILYAVTVQCLFLMPVVDSYNGTIDELCDVNVGIPTNCTICTKCCNGKERYNISIPTYCSKCPRCKDGKWFWIVVNITLLKNLPSLFQPSCWLIYISRYAGWSLHQDGGFCLSQEHSPYTQLGTPDDLDDCLILAQRAGLPFASYRRGDCEGSSSCEKVRSSKYWTIYRYSPSKYQLLVQYISWNFL